MGLRIAAAGCVLLCAVAWCAGPLLSRPDVRKALDYIKDHEPDQIAKQIAIAQVAAPPFHEQARAKVLAEEFRRAGLSDVETDGIGNVLGWIHGSSPRALVIAAHLDTVFPEGTDVTVKHS